jgi:hypothetical protein
MPVANLPEETLMDLGIKSAKRLKYLRTFYGLTHSVDYNWYNQFYHGSLKKYPDILTLNECEVLIQATNDVYHELKKTFEPKDIEWTTMVFDREDNPESSLWSLVFDDSKKYANVVSKQRKVMLDKIRKGLL